MWDGPAEAIAKSGFPSMSAARRTHALDAARVMNNANETGVEVAEPTKSHAIPVAVLQNKPEHHFLGDEPRNVGEVRGDLEAVKEKTVDATAAGFCLISFQVRLLH